MNPPGAEVQATGRPAARNRRRIAIGAVCLAVVACAAVVTVAVVNHNDLARTAVPAAGKAASAAEAGLGYVTALADGRGADAISFWTRYKEAKLVTSCGLEFRALNNGGVPDASTVRWKLDPGSVKVGATTPVLSDSENGLVASWSPDSAHRIFVDGTAKTSAGATVTTFGMLVSYSVSLSDTGQLKVSMKWM